MQDDSKFTSDPGTPETASDYRTGRRHTQPKCPIPQLPHFEFTRNAHEGDWPLEMEDSGFSTKQDCDSWAPSIAPQLRAPAAAPRPWLPPMQLSACARDMHGIVSLINFSNPYIIIPALERPAGNATDHVHLAKAAAVLCLHGQPNGARSAAFWHAGCGSASGAAVGYAPAFFAPAAPLPCLHTHSNAVRTATLWQGSAGGAAGLSCEPGVSAFRQQAGPLALATFAAGMEFAGPAYVQVAPQPVWTRMPLPPGVGCGYGGGRLMSHSQPLAEGNAALEGLGPSRQPWHLGGWGCANQAPMPSWPAWRSAGLRLAPR